MEMINRIVRIFLAIAAVGLLAAAHFHVQSASIMTDGAKAFLASLTAAQRQQATFDLGDAERMNWFYTPVPRKGLPLRQMQPAQRQLAIALLSAGLSQRGMIKATTIMSLEDVLNIIEKGDGTRRDPDLYFISIFGAPMEKGTWGFRFEGHHVSQNFTIVDGKVAGSPSFFGANPAEVKEGPRKGLRPLSREDDLARALILGLSPAGRNISIVDRTAPEDILTTNSRRAALKGKPSGLRISAMDARQKDMLHDLLDEYCYNMPESIAQMREDEIQKAGNDIWFAWSGGTELPDKHYYRIQSPTFLVEFDETQDNANHIHSVWRDFNGDFGQDVLAEHYRSSHE
jgi:hypothetical protein